MGRPCTHHHHVEAAQGPPEAFSPNDFLQGSINARVLGFGIRVQTLHSRLREDKRTRNAWVLMRALRREDPGREKTVHFHSFTEFLGEENTDSFLYCSLLPWPLSQTQTYPQGFSYAQQSGGRGRARSWIWRRKTSQGPVWLSWLEED